MFSFDNVCGFIGIVPGSKSERLERAVVAAILTALSYFTMVSALIRFGTIVEAVGVLGAMLDISWRVVTMLAIMLIYVEFYRYITPPLLSLILWCIRFPTRVLHQLKRIVNWLVARTSPSLTDDKICHKTITTPQVQSNESPSKTALPERNSRMSPALRFPSENKEFISVLSRTCNHKEEIYKALIENIDPEIKASVDFACKYCALVRLNIIADNKLKFYNSVPERHRPIGRAQFYNQVKKVQCIRKDYLNAIKRGESPNEEGLEIYERYISIKRMVTKINKSMSGIT